MTDPRKIDNTKYPSVKREIVDERVRGEYEIKDSKGKKHPVKEVERSEREIDSVHLVKIAPMFYLCTDNYKVLMIPFSIQFSVTEVLQLCAKIATNLEKLLDDIRGKDETLSKSSPEAVGAQKPSSDEGGASSPEDDKKPEDPEKGSSN